MQFLKPDSPGLRVAIHSCLYKHCQSSQQGRPPGLIRLEIETRGRCRRLLGKLGVPTCSASHFDTGRFSIGYEALLDLARLPSWKHSTSVTGHFWQEQTRRAIGQLCLWGRNAQNPASASRRLLITFLVFIDCRKR